MKWIARFSVIAFALACSATLSYPTFAQELHNSQIETSYVPPKPGKYIAILDRLKKRRVLELLAEFISPLRLPHRFYLVTKECGEVNAFYDAETWSLTICYEFAEFLETIAPKTDSPVEGFTQEEFLVGAMTGMVLHESGHAIFDMMKVPVFGREEDAADEMASFIALQFNKDIARTITRAYAYLYREWAWVPKDWAGYSDEHGADPQRFYNTLCLGYGGDPEAFKDFLEKGWLPRERAENCASEFEQVKMAFITTVLPFIDQAMMKKVQERDWLKPPAGK
jgi:hypothetical protein